MTTSQLFGYFFKKKDRPDSLTLIQTLETIAENDGDDEEIADLVNFERKHYISTIYKLLYESGHLNADHVDRIAQHFDLIHLHFSVKTLLAIFKEEKYSSIFSSILPIIIAARAPRAITQIIADLKKSSRLRMECQVARYIEPLVALENFEMMSSQVKSIIEEENQRAFFDGNFAQVGLNEKKASFSTSRRARSKTIYDISELTDKDKFSIDKTQPKSEL